MLRYGLDAWKGIVKYVCTLPKSLDMTAAILLMMKCVNLDMGVSLENRRSRSTAAELLTVEAVSGGSFRNHSRGMSTSKRISLSFAVVFNAIAIFLHR